MDIKDFLPKQTTVKLCRAEKELLVNPFTLRDDVWVQENFTQEQLLGLQTNPDPKIVLPIFFRLLDNESKKYLASAKIIEVDEMGEEKEITGLTASQKLLHLVSGIAEMALIFEAIAEAKNLSSPVMRDAYKTALKNKEDAEVKKKNQSGGSESSTLSVANTDGQSTISSPEQCDKLTDCSKQSEQESIPSLS